MRVASDKGVREFFHLSSQYLSRFHFHGVRRVGFGPRVCMDPGQRCAFTWTSLPAVSASASRLHREAAALRQHRGRTPVKSPVERRGAHRNTVTRSGYHKLAPITPSLTPIPHTLKLKPALIQVYHSHTHTQTRTHTGLSLTHSHPNSHSHPPLTHSHSYPHSHRSIPHTLTPKPARTPTTHTLTLKPARTPTPHTLTLHGHATLAQVVSGQTQSLGAVCLQ